MQHKISNDAFAAALSEPDSPVPPGISGPDGKKALRRFNIYRNNVAAGLIAALCDIFPAVERLVGEAFFRDMARIYVRMHAPDSPLLFRYGRRMPEFLATFEPVSHLAYLPDVARIELAWLDAFHAADADCFTGADLGAVPETELDGLRLKAHPAARVVRSPSAAVSIFSATRAAQSLSGIDPSHPEDGLVTRPGLEVQIRRLPPGAAVFLQALVDGQSLAEAAGAAEQNHAGFELPEAIRAMLEAGVFTGTGKNT